MVCKWPIRLIAVSLVLLLHCQNGWGQPSDTLVLRDLSLLTNVEIVSLDADGITIRPDRTLWWDEVLQGSSSRFQTELDRYIQETGKPLFQLRHRMAHRNFDELPPLADHLLQLTSGKPGRTRFLALAAAVHARVATGQREQAVIPLLELLHLRDVEESKKLPVAETGLRFSEDGICLDLLPIWFQPDQALRVLQQIPGDQVQQNTKAGRIYFESLQRCSADFRPEPSQTKSAWDIALSAQSAWFNAKQPYDLKSDLPEELTDAAAPTAIALYYEGLLMRRIHAENPGNQNAWKLKLLQIPAEFQDQFPELSAAAIYQVLGDLPDSDAEYDLLRSELANRLGNTWHGRRYLSNRN